MFILAHGFFQNFHALSKLLGTLKRLGCEVAYIIYSLPMWSCLFIQMVSPGRASWLATLWVPHAPYPASSRHSMTTCLPVTSEPWNARSYKARGLAFLYGQWDLSWCFWNSYQVLKLLLLFTFQRHIDYHWPKYKIIISVCRAMHPVVEKKALPSSLLSDSL